MAASAPPDGKKLIKLVNENLCHEHQWKPAGFYCNSCSKLICNDCLLESHKGCVNAMSTIENALKGETENVEECIRALDEEIKDLKRKLHETGQGKTAISTRQNDGQAALLREKAALEAKLDGDLAAQMKKLNDDHQKKKAALQEKYEEKKRSLATTCETREKERMKAEADLTKCITGKEDSLKSFQETRAIDSLREIKQALDKAMARNHGQIPKSAPSAADIELPIITSSQYCALDVEVVDKGTVSAGPAAGSRNTSRQPPGNQIEERTSEYYLPGFEGTKTLVLKFDFPGGHQTEGQPDPGRFYTPKSFHQYLPDTKQGRILKVWLKQAYLAGVLFVIDSNGDIVPDIPLKTEVGYKHGPPQERYPDPGYFQRVEDILRRKGVAL